MADDAAGPGAGDSPGTGSQLDRLLPLFEHTHGPATTGIVVAFAAVLGLVAGWITADFGVRQVAFVVAAALTGYLLYAQPTRRAVVAAGLYSLAGFLAVAPLLYELALVVAVDAPLQHVLSPTDLLVVLVFWTVAAVAALLANRVANGPFVARLRSRFAG